MFTPEERCAIRDLLLKRAADDETIVAAAVTGSSAAGAEDRWSDVDLYFGVADPTPRDDALERWSSFMYRELGALHHFDVDAGHAIYRGFLLPGGLEVDIAFADADRFGATGPRFRAVFGTVVEQPAARPRRARADELVGLGWHHALHAQKAIARGRPWLAEYWISAVRDQALALACLREGLAYAYAKGADALPSQLTAPLEQALVTSLEPRELTRALRVALGAFLREVDAVEPDLSARLRPVLDPRGATKAVPVRGPQRRAAG